MLHHCIVDRQTSQSVITGKQKRVSSLYRTATTAYPCYLPVLGGSAGAGRIRLTLCKINYFLDSFMHKHYFHYFYTTF